MRSGIKPWICRSCRRRRRLPLFGTPRAAVPADAPAGNATRLLLASALFLLATNFTKFLIGIAVYDQTHSTLAFSLIALVSFAPGLAASPLAGWMTDRYDRKTVLLGTFSMTVATCALLAAGMISGWAGLPLFAAAAALLSIAEATEAPAYGASVTLLVGHGDLRRFNGTAESCRALSLLAAPIAAGAIFGVAGTAPAALIAAGMASGSLLLLTFVRLPSQPGGGIVGAAQDNSGLREALRFILSHRHLLLLLGAFAVTNMLFAMFQVVFYPLLLSRFTELEVGAVRGFGALGLVGGGLILRRGGFRRPHRTIIRCGIVFAASLMIMALADELLLIALLYIISGAALAVMNGLSQTIWQASTPVEKQGRVFGIRRIAAYVAVPIGFLIAPAIEAVSSALSRSPPSAGAGADPTALNLAIIAVSALTLLVLLWLLTKVPRSQAKAYGC